MAEDKLLKVAYAVVDKKGKIIFDGEVLVYKTKTHANQVAVKEDGETVQRVSIYAA